MAEKVEEYEKLLMEMSPHMDVIFKQRITRALERVGACLHLPSSRLLRLAQGIVPSE